MTGVDKDAHFAMVRAEAELSRLREERDGTERARKAERVGRKAAEARCARLQQALRFYANEDDYLWHGDERGTIQKNDRGKVAREALAGPDTPADSPTLSDANPASVVGVPWNEDGYAPADSQECDHNFVIPGSAGDYQCDKCGRWWTPADSHEQRLAEYRARELERLFGDSQPEEPT